MTKPPSFGTFLILLITLWALNLADIYQTLFLKESGFLNQEANFFIDFFLREGRLPFLGAKLLALLLVTSILGRGWLDPRGIKLGGVHYEQIQVQKTIHFLLVAGVFYYILIVAMPFAAMAISGLFMSSDQMTF